MNIAQRFTLLVKGRIESVFESWEDPERSLHQLLLDMERQLDAAKRATAQAMANEDRLRSRIETLRQDASRWEDAARRALRKDQQADAREAMRRAELAARQADQLADQLAAQEYDTAQVRESVVRLNERLHDGRARLQLLQARIRQGVARRAMGKVMRGAHATDLHDEFDRLGEQVEIWASEQDAYLRLDDELTGRDFARRAERCAVDEAVEDRLERLRSELEAKPEAKSGDAA